MKSLLQADNKYHKERLTSVAPAFLKREMITLIVVPLTIESSIKITLFPLKFAVKGPNFFRTASCLKCFVGCMNVLPMYRFLQRTSAYGILD